jgi:hypothetical protein
MALTSACGVVPHPCFEVFSFCVNALFMTARIRMNGDNMHEVLHDIFNFYFFEIMLAPENETVAKVEFRP